MIELTEQYVVGVDYGTLSGRAVVVRVSDGAELGTAVHPYPHAVLERALPADLVGGGRHRAAAAAGVGAAGARGLPRGAAGRRAGRGRGRRDRPGAGDRHRHRLHRLHDGADARGRHAAQRGRGPRRPARTPTSSSGSTTPPRAQADRINELARTRGEAWLPRYGGLISSEWEFAKGLQLFEEDAALYDRMEHWVEAADWIVWQLCGTYVRNACTAGYKGQLQDGAYPSPEFLTALSPGFGDFVTDKLEHRIGALGERAGTLTAEAAAWTGLPEGIAVAVGNVDAHVTAPAAQAVGSGQMVAIMGTSTCHVMNAEVLREVPGMCGVVDGGIVDGLWGYEAGQSGVGDIFGWFVEHGVPVVRTPRRPRPPASRCTST